MKKSLLNKFMLLLCALVVGMGNAWAAEGDTHDFTQTLQQLLNNGASIASISIAQQDYPVKEVIISYTHNKFLTGDFVTAAVSVGGNSWGSAMLTCNTTTTESFYSSSTTGAITISFTNHRTASSGQGTFKVTNVRLVEGSSGGPSAAATTTTIDASGITNTDLKNGTAAGLLSASVTLTSGGSAVPSATVTWSGDNDAVATINSSTGVVTLVGEGDVNFTASYAGVENTYAASTSSKHKMTVTDTRYTTSTLTFTAAYSSPGATTKVDDSDDESATVTWLVSSDGTQSTYDGTKGIHYGTGSSAVKYITLSTSGISGTIKKVVVNASTANSVSATVGVTVGGSSFGGDAQSISSTATEYTFNETTTAKGQIIVTVTKPSSANGALYVKSVKVVYEPGSEISASNVDIAYDATDGSISYGIVRPVDGATLQATVADGATISNFTLGVVGATSIPFTCAANNESTPKTATVTLNYVKNEETLATKDVTITQGVNEAYFLTGRISFGSATGSTNINDASITGDDSKGNTWTITTEGTTSFTPNAGYAQVGSGSKPASTITFTTTLAQSVTIADFQAKFGGFNNTAGTITLKVGNNVVGTGSLSGDSDVTVVNGPELKAGTELTVTVTDIAKGVKCYYISYTVLSYDILGEAEMTNFTIPVDKTLTIHNGGVLTITNTLTNNGTAANLIIEDGGQLITSNAVNATVKKNITGYTNDNNGWNFIASPITGSITPGVVTNLLGEQINDNPVTYNYDLYRLNNTDWENYHQHTEGFVLANGQGYLYAKSSDVTLSFAGAIKPFTTEGGANQVALADGWNLVGNPYTFNVYSSKSYYTIQTEGGVNVIKVVASNAPIAPCTGIVVQSDGAGSVAFTTSAAEWATGNNGNIELTLAQAVTNRGVSAGSTTTIDNAIVSFNEGSQLEKFYFGTQDANIYIPQGNEEYAIVSAEAQGEMPVSFKAAKDGEYTLTVNAENVEMNYLHLIDNLTGADTDLLATPSYTFNARTTDYASRFRLVFGANDENGASTGSATFAYVSNGQVVVNGTGILQVVDMLGRIVASQEVTTANCQLSTANYKTGVYVLRLVNNGDVKTQKMVIE